MALKSTIITLLVATLASTVVAKSCGKYECVTYYSSNTCDEGAEIGNYVPTCAGNCFQYDSFHAIQVRGNHLYGTDCVAYSDINCENEVGDSRNWRGEGCLSLPDGAKSMKCYYDCS